MNAQVAKPFLQRFSIAHVSPQTAEVFPPISRPATEILPPILPPKRFRIGFGQTEIIGRDRFLQRQFQRGVLDGEVRVAGSPLVRRDIDLRLTPFYRDNEKREPAFVGFGCCSFIPL